MTDLYDEASELLERSAAAHRAGRRRLALELVDRAHAKVSRAGGARDPNLVPVLLQRATLREDAGQLTKAAADFARTSHILGRNASDDFARFRVQALRGLGDVRRKQGLKGEARRLLLAALRRAEAALGEDHLEVASVKTSLGILCKYSGRFDEAEGHYREALAIVERECGPESEAAAGLYHNLGGLEHERGRYRLAEPLARRAVEVRTRLLGLDHPDTAEDRAAWAAILDRLGRHDEAEQIYAEVLTVFRRTRGSRSFDVAVTLHNLACSRAARGDLALAQRLCRQALSLKVSLFGARHPEVEATRLVLDRIERPT